MSILKVLFSVSFIFLLNNLFAQGVEYEFNIGPQTSKAIIKDYEVGTLNQSKPMNDRVLFGYSFNMTIRTKNAKFQPGLRIKNDLSRYNVYLPVFWPEDYMAKDQSRWDHIYSSNRLGFGANLRLNLGNFYIQPGYSYLFALSQKSKHEFYYAFSGDTEVAPGVDYSSGGGSAGELEIGIKLGKGEVKKFGMTAGFQYLFAEQTYTDEIFLQHWVVQPMDFYLQFSYRIMNDADQDQP